MRIVRMLRYAWASAISRPSVDELARNCGSAARK